MSSGVAVNDECATEFNELKLRKAYRYIIFALTDDLKTIEIRSKGRRDATYDEFLAELKQAEEMNQCRYGVFDVDFVGAEAMERAKLVFMLWSPDNAAVKQKMLYASSKDYLKRELVGIGKEVQATDFAEASLDNVLEKLQNTR